VHTAVPSFVHKFEESSGAVVAASSYVLAWNISWLGFGLSDHILLVCYPWGKVRYPLFGYLA
jgi:hypothetical protein